MRKPNLNTHYVSERIIPNVKQGNEKRHKYARNKEKSIGFVIWHTS